MISQELKDRTFYFDDKGVTITLDCETDTTGATARAILVKFPDGTIESLDASQVGGEENKIQHPVVAADFSSDKGEGIHEARADITFSANRRQQGAPVRFRVLPSWEATT